MTKTRFVDIVFDGPPDHHAPRFIEVEDENGRSLPFARWVKREDGNWAIRLVPDVSDLPHVHLAGTMIGKDTDECAHCGQDIRSAIHRG